MRNPNEPDAVERRGIEKRRLEVQQRWDEGERARRLAIQDRVVEWSIPVSEIGIEAAYELADRDYEATELP